MSLPEENLFGFASTLVPPGTTTSSTVPPSEYSRGNSFWYSILGCDRTRRMAWTSGQRGVTQGVLIEVLRRINQRDDQPPELVKSRLELRQVSHPPVPTPSSPSSSLISSTQRLLDDNRLEITLTTATPDLPLNALDISIHSSGQSLLLQHQSLPHNLSIPLDHPALTNQSLITAKYKKKLNTIILHLPVNNRP